jgi:hypothetical protein
MANRREIELLYSIHSNSPTVISSLAIPVSIDFII